MEFTLALEFTFSSQLKLYLNVKGCRGKELSSHGRRVATVSSWIEKVNA